MPWTTAEAKKWNSEWDDKLAAKAAKAANSIYAACVEQAGGTDEKCAPKAIRLAKWMAKTGKLDTWDGATSLSGADMAEDILKTNSERVGSCLRYDDAELLPSDVPENGVLIRDVVVAKPGVFKYGDHWEFKPPEEILSDAFLKSIVGLPITDEHPDSGLVTPETIADVTKGLTGTSPRLEDGKAVNQALIFDQGLRAAVESGEKRQVSIGFLTDLVEKEGEYEGQRYDRIQTNIRVNHLAATKHGRCGQECSIKVDDKLGVDSVGSGSVHPGSYINTSGNVSLACPNPSAELIIGDLNPSAILHVPGAVPLMTDHDLTIGGTLYVNDIQPLSAAASQAGRTNKDAVGRQTTDLANESQSSVVRADKGAETRSITMSENQEKLTLGKAVLDCHMDASGAVSHENCPYMESGFQTKLASFQSEIDSFLKRLTDAEKAKDEAEAKVKELQGQIAAKTDTNQLIQNKCEEMKKRLDEIEQGKGFEARMDSRMSLIDLARKFVQNYAHNGKSNREIKVDVIKALRPKFVAEGKDDKFVDAYFDATIEGQQLEAEKETKAQINTVSAGNDAIEARVAELKAKSLNLKQTGKKAS